MKRLALLLCLIWLGSAAVSAPAGVAEAETFLSLVRSRSALQNSFADLAGSITHLKRNQGAAKHYPVRFLIRFSKDKVQAKLTLNNSEEHYFEQKHNDRASVRTAADVKDGGLLGQMGFRIGDLTMDFLNYPVVAEETPDTYKTLKCRILVVRSPENKPVRVWIASEYLFPMRAEFFDSFDKLKNGAARTLEITGFEKVGDYYVASNIALLSSSFRSRIAFKECTATKSDSPEAIKAFSDKSL